jgi:predicted PurR-regulated permease PerM
VPHYGGKHTSDDLLDSGASRRERNLTHNLKLVWTIIGICLIIVGIGFILRSVSSAIAALLIAGLVVFILRRPMAFLNKRGWPRILAAAVLVVGLLAVLVVIIISFIPLLTDQIILLIRAIPGYLANAQSWWESLFAHNPDLVTSPVVQEWGNHLWSSLTGFFTSLQTTAIDNIYTTTISIGTIVIVIITALIIAFWLLYDYERLTHELHAFTGGPSRWYMILFGTICSRVLGGFLKGTLITALCVAVAGSVAYWILGLPSPIALGLLLGLCSIVPYLGPMAAAVVIGILGLISGSTLFILGIILSIVIPWVMHTIVQPRIMESTVNLHPGITMLAIIIGAALGGVIGTIVAIPISGIIKYSIIYFYESAAGRQIVNEGGALFDGVPSDPVDPVSDATDGFLTYEQLKARVESIEGEIRKVDPVHQGKTVAQRLANPIAEPPSPLRPEAVHPEDEHLLGE